MATLIVGCNGATGPILHLTALACALFQTFHVMKSLAVAQKARGHGRPARSPAYGGTTGRRCRAPCSRTSRTLSASPGQV